MQRTHVPTRDTNVSSPKLDARAGEMGALALIERITQASW